MSPLASFGSAQFSRMRRENGSPLTGQSAPSARRQRRIGWAALTYARRYALFTLVGIAGEDDLDAPDLSAPANSSSEPETPALKKIGRLNGRRDHSARRLPRRKLDPEASAALRERLAAELKDVNSAEETLSQRKAPNLEAYPGAIQHTYQKQNPSFATWSPTVSIACIGKGIRKIPFLHNLQIYTTASAVGFFPGFGDSLWYWDGSSMFQGWGPLFRNFFDHCFFR